MQRVEAGRRVAGVTHDELVAEVERLKKQLEAHLAERADDKPLIADPIVEKAIREELEKPEGKLTVA